MFIELMLTIGLIQAQTPEANKIVTGLSDIPSVIRQLPYNQVIFSKDKTVYLIPEGSGSGRILQALKAGYDSKKAVGVIVHSKRKVILGLQGDEINLSGSDDVYESSGGGDYYGGGGGSPASAGKAGGYGDLPKTATAPAAVVPAQAAGSSDGVYGEDPAVKAAAAAAAKAAADQAMPDLNKLIEGINVDKPAAPAGSK